MIDLTSVRNAMDEASKIVADLDGREVVDPDSTTTKRVDVAQVTRELIRLADLLDMAAALARNEYHVTKGAPDPIFDRSQP